MKISLELTKYNYSDCKHVLFPKLFNEKGVPQNLVIMTVKHCYEWQNRSRKDLNWITTPSSTSGTNIQVYQGGCGI